MVLSFQEPFYKNLEVNVLEKEYSKNKKAFEKGKIW